MDQFEGTWVYNNAGVYFKIVLEKIVKKNSGYFFYDTLEGEYQYTVNGNDLVNTFSNPALISAIRTPILLKSNWKPLCPDCSPQNRRVDLILAERSRNLSGGIILRRITVNGKPALQGSVSKGGVATYDPENPPAYFTTSIPEQDFLFIKQ